VRLYRLVIGVSAAMLLMAVNIRSSEQTPGADVGANIPTPAPVTAAAPASASPLPTEAEFAAVTESLLYDTCGECHNSFEFAGDLDLTEYYTLESLKTDRDLWEKILDKLKTREMPPIDVVRPEEEIAALVTFLVYMAGVMGLAIASNQLLKGKNFLAEYFLGSRSLGMWAFALTFAATAASGGTFTGFPSKIYVHGWILALWIHVALVVWFNLLPQDRYLQAIMPVMGAFVAAAIVLAWRARVRVTLAVLVGAQIVWGGDVFFISRKLAINSFSSISSANSPTNSLGNSSANSPANSLATSSKVNSSPICSMPLSMTAIAAAASACSSVASASAWVR